MPFLFPTADARLSEKDAEELMAWMRNALGPRVANVKVRPSPGWAHVAQRRARLLAQGREGCAGTQGGMSQALCPGSRMQLGPRTDGSSLGLG